MRQRDETCQKTERRDKAISQGTGQVSSCLVLMPTKETRLLVSSCKSRDETAILTRLCEKTTRQDKDISRLVISRAETRSLVRLYCRHEHETTRDLPCLVSARDFSSRGFFERRD
uniref:Uncharacterized protein n=1 Tax=Cacopsylla melanoneura TaxID=428564 RepID=A0A8D8UF54_9HEMI